jgi:hypothetical protein
MKRIIEDPENEATHVNVWGFVSTGSPETDTCQIPRPHIFHDPVELALARRSIKYYRDRGYCPLHRHPALVEYIEAVTSCYGSVLQSFLENVQYDAAMANPKIRALDNTHPERLGGPTHAEAWHRRSLYNVFIKAQIRLNGLSKIDDEVMDEEIAMETELPCGALQYIECRGITLFKSDLTQEGCRLTESFLASFEDVYCLGLIMGSRELKSLLVDGILVFEIAFLRDIVRGKPHFNHGSPYFWGLVQSTKRGDYSPVLFQCLRDTIPSEILGKELYDVHSLSAAVVEKMEYCRIILQMDGLPDDPCSWMQKTNGIQVPSWGRNRHI